MHWVACVLARLLHADKCRRQLSPRHSYDVDWGRQQLKTITGCSLQVFWCWERTCVCSWCLGFLQRNSQNAAVKRIFLWYIREISAYISSRIPASQGDRYDLEFMHSQVLARATRWSFCAELRPKPPAVFSLQTSDAGMGLIANSVFCVYHDVEAYARESGLIHTK